MTHRMRRRNVPGRIFGTRFVVARPQDGTPVVIDSTAAVVWRMLNEWMMPQDLDRGLADVYPDVAEDERVSARQTILETLWRDGLIECE